MARPKKSGLFYFPFDVEFFHDTRVRVLKIKFGAEGVFLYEYILCAIYGNKGYYIKPTEDFYDIAADDIGIDPEKVREIVRHLCGRAQLFDEQLFETEGILTSSDIQRTFQEIKKNLRRDVKVDDRYWLLPPDETLGFIKFPRDTESCDKSGDRDNKSRINDDKSCINDDKSRIYSTKESKANKSKVNENRAEESEAARKSESAAAAAAQEEELERIIDTYEENIAPVTQIVRNAVRERLDSAGTDTVLFAIDEAAKHNGRSWAYVDAVIKRLENGGTPYGSGRSYCGGSFRPGVYEDDTGFDYDSIEAIMQAKYDK